MSNSTRTSYPLPPGVQPVPVVHSRKPQPVIDLAAELARKNARRLQQLQSSQSAPERSEPARVEPPTPPVENVVAVNVDEATDEPELPGPPPDATDLSEFPGAEPPTSPAAKRLAARRNSK